MTPFEKSKRLYEILETRVGAYEILLKALLDTGQTGALKILKNQTPLFHTYGSISYDINHILGTGCLGTKVYRGTCGDRDAAIKVIHSELIEPKLAQREVEILKKIDYHENIVRYFTSESKDNLILIALERCVISLQDEVKLNLIQMNPIDILKKCTKGLAHLHKNKIIHRDMKPANILFTEHKQIKISDFGVSKQIPVGMTSVSLHSGVVGTADWMAPEVIQLLTEATGTTRCIHMSTSADIFSLGCIFVFALTKGCHPYGGDSISRQYNIRNNTHHLESLKIENNWLKLIETTISPLPSNRPSAEEILRSDCFRLYGTLRKKDQISSSTSGEESLGKSHCTLDQSSAVSHKALLPQLPGRDVAEIKMQGLHLGHPSQSKKYANGTGITLDAFESSEFHGKSNQMSTTEIKNKSVSPATGENIGESKLNANDTPKMNAVTGYNIETSREDIRSGLSENKNQKMKELLKKYTSSYNNGDENKISAIFTLVGGGVQVAELEQIVMQGADWNLKDNGGQSILHVAAACGHVEALKYFISLGADINSRDNYEGTILHAACSAKQNFKETLEVLAENNVDIINAVDWDGDNAVLLAAFVGRTKEELEEIVRLGGDWKIKNKGGRSVLHRAAQGGNVEALKYFISLGADVNSYENRRTVLHRACLAKQNLKEMLHLLMKNDLKINAVDCDGNNAVFLAASWGRTKDELVELVKVGGEWNVANKYGESVLHRAAEGGNVEALKYFISLGADVNSKDHSGETPAHRLKYASQNFEMCVNILRNKGALLNSKSNVGKTLEGMLQEAGESEKIDILKKYV